MQLKINLGIKLPAIVYTYLLSKQSRLVATILN